MSVTRRRLGVFGASAVALACLAGSAALLTGSTSVASAATAPYGTASPPADSPSPSPSDSPSPSASASSSTSASPDPTVQAIPDSTGSPSSTQPSPQAQAEADRLIASLPAGTPQAVKDAIQAAVNAFANAGLTSDQQVAAVDGITPVVQAVAGRTDLSTDQQVAAIQTAAGLVTQAVQLPSANQSEVLAGITSGVLASITPVVDPAVRNSLVGAINTALAQAAADGSLGSLTNAVVSQLIRDLAATLATGSPAGNAQGVGVTYAVDQATGNVTFTVTGLAPGTPVLLVLSVTDHTVSAAAYRRGAQLDAAGRGSVILAGTANETGIARLTATASSLGSTSAAQTAATLNRTVLGVAGTATSGAKAVFSTPISLLQRPTLLTKTPVVAYRGSAVLSGASKAGQTLRLYGRTSGGTYRVLRSTVVDGSGRFTFTVAPTATMRYFVRTTSGSPDSPSVVVNVRALVTQSVTRTARLTYRFAGRVLPALSGTVVNVYRSSANGSLLAGSVRTAADGSWTLSRRFGSAGTFTFFSRSGVTKLAIAGLSPVQRVTLK